MPAHGQLRLLAHAAQQNVAELAADARLLLVAGRYARAHALATLALEELGKMMLCRAVLGGQLSDKDFQTEWPDHESKLERSRILAILNAPTIDRILGGQDDAAMKLRGLYVDGGCTTVVPIARHQPRHQGGWVAGWRPGAVARLR